MKDRSDLTFEAGPVTFVVRHEQWDANIHSHADQGVIILVQGEADGRTTDLLQFNCFDVEKSYIYAPEGEARICRIDPIVDGNPIRWSCRQMRENLPRMLAAAGYGRIADKVNMRKVAKAIEALEPAARERAINGRLLVKHNRGTDIFEAGNLRFGLEMRDLGADGGLAIHVLTDLVGTPSDHYKEETEILAFDCFREQPHYHYGPRNKNHRVYWDKTIIRDPLEWTVENVFKAGKLKEMIVAAGYPGVAQDMDEGLVAELLPAIAKRAREMQPKVNAKKAKAKKPARAKLKAAA